MGPPRIRLEFRSVSEVARALVIMGAVGLASGSVGIWAVVRAEFRRRTVNTEPLRPWPTVVMFSSDDCDVCDPVRVIVRSTVGDGRFREIAYQRDSELFRSAGIDRVPAVVLVDERGRAVNVFEGPVGSYRMRRAVRRAGVG